MANTVIMVWKKYPDSGFGDLLRGTIYLYSLSQKLKFDLKVDMQLHPVSNFLIAPPHQYSEYVLQNESKIINGINTDPKWIEGLIRAGQRSPNPVLITTNYSDSYNNSPPPECKRFMRNLLIPNSDFKSYLFTMCNELKLVPNYSILHFRLGDDELLHAIANLQLHEDLLPLIDANMTPNAYIMTDSQLFKTYLKQVRPDLADRITPTTPIHLSHSTENDIASIKETLFDFMLLSNAKLIKTHSVYGWISGFVHWVGVIHNVRLINMKQPLKSMKPIMSPKPIVTHAHNPIVAFMNSIHSSPRPAMKLAFNKMF
jgi:hypothetical protein